MYLFDGTYNNLWQHENNNYSAVSEKGLNRIPILKDKKKTKKQIQKYMSVNACTIAHESNRSNTH